MYGSTEGGKGATKIQQKNNQLYSHPRIEGLNFCLSFTKIYDIISFLTSNADIMFDIEKETILNSIFQVLFQI